ncbi:MAG: biotin synthase BioB [Myxococcota bacterium]
MFDSYEELSDKALRDESPSHDEAHWILDGKDLELLPLLQAAFAVRRQYFGRRVGIHVLNNVQNGLCPEDCGYCSQSKVSQADLRPYAMKSDREIFAAADEAARGGAARYCLVLSGRGPSLARTRRLADLIRRLKDRYAMEICLSVGLLGDEQAKLLAEAGLDRLNHNLNTSERHYPEICTTHDWSDRVSTLEAAKRHGIETCSGLIIGMGETSEDIVEVALKLLELETPSIPVNFLIPIDGNPVQDDGSLTPERCLRALCLMRFTNPRAEIRMAGGREGHLRGLQALGLYPANSLFVGGYLTTRGDPFAETYAMIEDAGFAVERPEGHWQPTDTGRLRFRLTGDRALLRPDVVPAPE